MKHFFTVLSGRIIGIVLLGLTCGLLSYGGSTLVINHPDLILNTILYLLAFVIILFCLLIGVVSLTYILEFIYQSFKTPLLKRKNKKDD